MRSRVQRCCHLKELVLCLPFKKERLHKVTITHMNASVWFSRKNLVSAAQVGLSQQLGCAWEGLTVLRAGLLLLSC